MVQEFLAKKLKNPTQQSMAAQKIEADGEKHISLRKLIPNVLTILALGLGLTSIRLGLDARFEGAVMAIVAAAFLDALDGRVARFLRAESKIGAQLDSLVDFLNFGIAPVLLLYIWAMEDMGRLGWLAMLAYTVCAALRLARFNVHSRDPDRPVWADNFFIGMPSPAAGNLALAPLMLSFTGIIEVKNYLFIVGLYIIVLAGMMISTIPTFSPKRLVLSVTRKQAMPLLLGIGVIAGGFFTFPWFGLLLLGSIYFLTMPLVIFYYYKLKRQSEATTPNIVG